MHHIGKRIFGFCLTAVLLTSVLPGALIANAAEANTENTASQENTGFSDGCEEVDFSTLSDDERISSVEDYMEFSGNGAPLVGSSAPSLPEECDNSTNENSIYCPPIGDQGGVYGCACWSATYYNYTYTAHRAYGIPTTENNFFHQYGHITSAIPAISRADRTARETTTSSARWVRLP